MRSRGAWKAVLLAAALVAGGQAAGEGDEVERFVKDARRYAESAPGPERERLARTLRRRHGALGVESLREGLRTAFPPTEPASAEARVVARVAHASGPGFPYRDYPYELRLPAGYTPERPWPVFLWVNGKGTSDGGWRVWDEALPEAVLVSPRMPADDPANPDSPTYATARATLMAVLPDLASACAVDPDRVSVGGFSMGGCFAWTWAMFQGDRLAGSVPGAGFVTRDPRFVRNCLGVPLWIVQGGKDPTITEAEFRSPLPVLEGAGAEFVWDFYPEGGHALPAESMPRIAAWLAERRRGPEPRRLARLLASAMDPWGRHEWVHLTRWKGVLDLAAEAREGNEVELTVAPVEGYEAPSLQGLEVYLNDGLVDLDRAVTVRLNGRQVHRGKVERDPALALDLYLERRDPARVHVARVVVKGEDLLR